MIDLKNTYIENDRGELFCLYMAALKEVGAQMCAYIQNGGSCDTSNVILFDKLGTSPYCVKVSSLKSAPNGLKQITLADLKPAKPFLQTGEDFEHTKTLNFILERMIKVHGENESVDFIHQLRNAIIFVERMEEPATVGGNDKKPNVKVEYVRVDSSEAVHYFTDIATHLYSTPSDSATPLELQDYIDNLALGDDCLYRKVGREVTWQDDLFEYLDSIGVKYYISKGDDSCGDEIEFNSAMSIGELNSMCSLVHNANK